uniref:Uncharacterized protein n=1 Tax=Rhizophora mucronata TaxID=61149 RepID=A0A2P2P7E3_RHIMU
MIQSQRRRLSRVRLRVVGMDHSPLREIELPG